jgi:hypothetical protein
MDGQAAGLELDPRPDGGILRRPDARVTPSVPDVKGKPFAALDIRPRRRYLEEKATPDGIAAANQYFAPSTPVFGVYTEFGIHPVVGVISLTM